MIFKMLWKHNNYGPGNTHVEFLKKKKDKTKQNKEKNKTKERYHSSRMIHLLLHSFLLILKLLSECRQLTQYIPVWCTSPHRLFEIMISNLLEHLVFSTSIFLASCKCFSTMKREKRECFLAIRPRLFERWIMLSNR